MNRLVKGIVAVAAVVAITPALAHAGGDTTTTTADEVPTDCIVDIELWGSGPARQVHALTGGELPVWCNEIEGLCIEVEYPETGPSRLAHRRGDPPCVPAAPACDIVLVAEDLDLDIGPARTPHQVTQRPAGNHYPYEYEIPQDCYDALSGGLVPAGSDSGTIVWLAALLVGVGGALLVTRRAIATRTR